jgi:predicted phosphodiesterase
MKKIQLLITYLRNNISTKEIARKLNSTPDAVKNAISRYSLEEHRVQQPSTHKFLENLDLDNLNDDLFEQKKKQAKLQWKLPRSTKQTQKKPYKTALFLPDAHIPHHNEPAVKAILQLMDDVCFDKFVILGDYMDLSCISHWNKNKHRTLEMQRLKSDYIIGNSLLDEFDKRLPKNCDKYYLEGNHENWAEQLVDEMPVLEGMVEPKNMLFLDERKYKYSKYNELVKFGRLYATHGIYVGSNPIKKHIDELKVNIIFGHTHTLGLYLSSSCAREIAFAGYNAGCVSDLSPDYMKNRPNAWNHGFAIGYFYPNGYFDIQLVRILNGKCIVNQKEYNGNTK